MLIDEAKIAVQLSHVNICQSSISGGRQHLLHRPRVHRRQGPLPAPGEVLRAGHRHPARPRSLHRHGDVGGSALRPHEVGQLRAAAEPHPPRRQPAERARLVRRRGEDRRLRHRQGQQTQPRDRERGHQGQVLLHVARAGLGRPHRRPDGHLQLGHLPVRDDHRRDALPRGEGPAAPRQGPQGRDPEHAGPAPRPAASSSSRSSCGRSPGTATGVSRLRANSTRRSPDSCTATGRTSTAAA
jgi:hypothetical protein